MEQDQDARLDTPEKRTAIAARLDGERWKPRNNEDLQRNNSLRAMIKGRAAYIFTSEETRADNTRLQKEIDQM